MKGISPLVASVLLIAITMAVAAVLATYVSNLTTQTTTGQVSCIGGSVNYISAAYPKFNWDSSITAVVEAQFVSLGDFEFEVLKTDDTRLNFPDTQKLRLDPGESGTVKTGRTGLLKSAINEVRITTNCTTVNTEWSELK